MTEYILDGEVPMPNNQRGIKVVPAIRKADGVDVVIKIRSKRRSFRSEQERLDWLRNSKRLLTSNAMGYSNIAQIYEIIETPKKYYVIMERARGVDLFAHLYEEQRIYGKTKSGRIAIARQVAYEVLQ